MKKKQREPGPRSWTPEQKDKITQFFKDIARACEALKTLAETDDDDDPGDDGLVADLVEKPKAMRAVTSG